MLGAPIRHLARIAQSPRRRVPHSPRRTVAVASYTKETSRPQGTQFMSNSFMAQAIELAVDNVRAGHGGPFAALVVRDGAVIATGVNQVTSTNDPTAHAEVVAIRAACKKLGSFQLTGCDLYTTC